MKAHLSRQTSEKLAAIEFKRILVLTDYNETFAPAREFAVQFARLFDSELFFTHFESKRHLVTSAPSGVAHIGNLYLQDLETQQHALAQSLTKENVRFQVLLEVASLQRDLERIVRERDCDLIILGTHGYLGVTKTLLGSMAEMVIHTSPVPVITVRQHAVVRDGAGTKKVLFASDLTKHSRRALRFACAIAARYEADLQLVHVMTESSEATQVREEVVARIESQLNEQDCSEAAVSCNISRIVASGPLVEAILEQADCFKADLIVMGAKHMPELNSRFTDSSSYRVAASSACPVMTVSGF